MASLKDIAEKAGTSIAAVSIALHGAQAGRRRVGAETAERIREIAKELNYAPSAAARMMRTKKSGQIGVLTRNAPDRPMHNMSNYETITGLTDALADVGVLPVLIPLKLTGGKFDDLPIFREKLLDGAIFLDSVPKEVAEKTSAFCGACVFVESEWEPFNCVRRDELAVGELAVRKLVESGCERIAYYGLEIKARTHFSTLERLEGVKRACEELGKELLACEVTRRNSKIPPPGSPPVEFHREFLRNVENDVEKLLPFMKKDRKTGVVAYNATLAHAAAAGFGKKGFSAGTDFSLCTCDVAFENMLMWPELASCEFNRYQEGREAAELLLQILNGKQAKSRKLEPSWLDGATMMKKNGGEA